VKKEKPPRGKAPVEWFLATSDPVNSPEEAYKYVGYYMQRWKIERFHYVLKSGCAIEKLQERTIDKTAMLILSVSVETGKKPSAVILERIDETHCNPLKQWENDGSPADLTPAQVNDYIARSRLAEEEIPYTFAAGTIQFSVSLGVNDVYFIRVIA
jgi:hypothetical protein